MNKQDKDIDKLKNEDTNKTINEGNAVPNINPVAKQDVDNEKIMKGEVGGAPNQKSGSRGASDIQDGGTESGGSAGSH